MHYKIVGVYDTETSNIGEGSDTRAVCCLYIYNDISMCDLTKYTPDCPEEHVRFYRHEVDMLEQIEDCISEYSPLAIIPVICAYNLGFDLQTLMHSLSKRYAIRANAQSTTNLYTLDLYDKASGACLLRLWDTYHLEMRGLEAMGETCGLPKAKGKWDYDKVRHPETPLTDEERYYAKRDVQVIPAYLRFILESNEWAAPDMLGFRIITKTSLVRQMAKSTIYNLRPRSYKLALGKMYELTCDQERPYSYYVYALRKACFRGGFTFTAANNASQVQCNVASMDAVSMHHAFINGRYVPVHFRKLPRAVLQQMAENVLKTSVENVLKNYHMPFSWAFHARIRFDNIRLRRGSVFERDGIALLAQAKFKGTVGRAEYGENERAKEAERMSKLAGWVDKARNPLFAFGKLMSADIAVVHVSELELYTMSRVYEWDAMRVEIGEGTSKFALPPDYVTLQSNALFTMKSEVKEIISHYTEGVPYEGDMSDLIPEGIAYELRKGTMSEDFLKSWYTSTVKGMYNGIFGTQAQDVFKPSYTVDAGDLVIDDATRATAATWAGIQPEHVKVFYNYGLRIVGGSRLHLVLALEAVHAVFGDDVKVTGGDTDSIKAAFADGVRNADIEAALKPLADACERAISRTCRRIRRDYPDMASSMSKVGSFEVEDCAGHERYAQHVDLWNKTRASLDCDGHVHVTAAGLPQPRDLYTAKDAIEDLMREGLEFGDAVHAVIGYNAELDNSICHILEHHRPLACETYDDHIEDYTGRVYEGKLHQAIALYPASRKMGDTLKTSNLQNVRYLRGIGAEVPCEDRYITREGGNLVIEQ